jgi:hypothetical protein
MGRVARNRFRIIPGAGAMGSDAASSRLLAGMRKALPSILIGAAAAALVRYIAESRLLESENTLDGPDSHPKSSIKKGEPATNGHQETHPDRLTSFS